MENRFMEIGLIPFLFGIFLILFSPFIMWGNVRNDLLNIILGSIILAIGLIIIIIGYYKSRDKKEPKE